MHQLKASLILEIDAEAALAHVLLEEIAGLTVLEIAMRATRIAAMRYFTCSRSPARIGLRKSQFHPSEAPGGNCSVPWVFSPSASERPNSPCATMPPKCEAFANSSSTCTGV